LATVLHYVQTWLPLSAGFVHGHVSRSRHRAPVLARDPLEHTATYPHRPVHSLARLPRRRQVRTAAITAYATFVRADLVHVHFGYVVDDVLSAARRRRLPVVLSLHGEDATALPLRAPRHYDAARGAVAAVVVPSAFLADRAVDLGFDRARVRIVPAGIDTSYFVPTPLPDGPPSAVFVGRLVEKKGLDVLLAAWPHVREALPDARLTVIGDGPLQGEVTGAGITHERPDPDRRRAQVRDAIARAHVVVQPSRTATTGDAESLLLVNLEGQASGRPVVSTRHGGIPEFVDDGATGLLVPEGDPTALADALVHLLGDRAEAERLGRAGPAWAARFDVRACTARLDDLYDEVLAARR
jgi:glycosyltransferase involved in cell wall biosynthesis